MRAKRAYTVNMQVTTAKGKQKVIIGMLLVLLLALFLSPMINSFKTWLTNDLVPLEERMQSLKQIFLAICLPLIGIGLWIIYIGQKTINSQQFPPANTKTVLQTRVLQGTKAAVRGHFLQVCGGIIAGLAALMLSIIWKLTNLILTTP